MNNKASKVQSVGTKTKTRIKSLIGAVVITCVLGSIAVAQQPGAQAMIQQPAVGNQNGQVQAYVQPGVQPSFIQPIQQNPFYFGMQVELKRDSWGRTTLRIVGVTPGSPAQRAGLEYGDEIRRVNGRGFRWATDSFDAVRRLNQFVSNSGFGGPAPATAGAAAMVVGPMPSPNPIARMVVRNVRNGMDVHINVFPTRIGGGGGAPAAAAAMSAGG